MVFLLKIEFLAAASIVVTNTSFGEKEAGADVHAAFAMQLTLI
jgi:hypothetical protein